MEENINVETKEEFKKRLNHFILDYVEKGYHVVSQTEYSASLVKPKKFNFLLFIILCLIWVLPGIFYLLYYLLVMKDQNVYLYS